MRESTEIWNDAARSLEFQQNFQACADCYERAKRFGDESSGTLLNLAVSYLQLYEFYRQDKYLALARDFLLSGIEKDSQNPKFHHYLGLAYLALGEKEIAAREFFYESEKKAEESSEMLFRFDLPAELPSVYAAAKSEVYDLFPDPSLYKIFDMVKGFPLDQPLFQSLKETYGDKDSASLMALYLRSIYFKVFEDADFSGRLGVSSPQEKWEALLVFFVRGMNKESKALVKDSMEGGKLDLSKLPAYTRMLIDRYRREILAVSYDKESFTALINLPLKKLLAINAACEEARGAKESGDGKRRLAAILDGLRKMGLAHKKGDSFALSDGLLAGFEESVRLKAKLASRLCDQECFILMYKLLRERRYAYALELAKKIRALYEESESMAYIKDVLSQLALSQDEKFEIISEA